MYCTTCGMWNSLLLKMAIGQGRAGALWGGGGGGEVQDQGFHLKVSVNPIVCLEKVIFSVG